MASTLSNNTKIYSLSTTRLHSRRHCEVIVALKVLPKCRDASLASRDRVFSPPAQAGSDAVGIVRRFSNSDVPRWRCFAIDDGAGWPAPVVRDDDARRLHC